MPLFHHGDTEDTEDTEKGVKGQRGRRAKGSRSQVDVDFGPFAALPLCPFLRGEAKRPPVTEALLVLGIFSSGSFWGVL